MSVDKKIVSDLQKSKHTIKAQSTQVVNFLGAEPNYYRITNGGSSPIYLGVTMMPTDDFFDMRIPEGSSKLFVDAYGHEQIYFFNPSMEDANIIITSFSADFDPSVLAMTDIGESPIELDIGSESIIKGFETSLPSGSNVIGSVGFADNAIEKLDEILDKMFFTGADGQAIYQSQKELESIRTIVSDMNNKTGFDVPDSQALYQCQLELESIKKSMMPVLNQFHRATYNEVTITSPNDFYNVPFGQVESINDVAVYDLESTILNAIEVLPYNINGEQLSAYIKLSEYIENEELYNKTVSADLYVESSVIVGNGQAGVYSIKTVNSYNILDKIYESLKNIESGKRNCKYKTIIVDTSAQMLTCNSTTLYFGKILTEDATLSKLTITITLDGHTRSFDGITWNKLCDSFRKYQIDNIVASSGILELVIEEMPL